MQNTTLKELKVMKEMRSNLVLVGSGFLGESIIAQLENYEMIYEAFEVSRTFKKRDGAIKHLQVDIDRSVIDLPVGKKYKVIYMAPPSTTSLEDDRMSNFLHHNSKHNITQIVYISTSGVYGDHEGNSVNELVIPNPITDRAIRRLSAEKQLDKFCNKKSISSIILRVPGIYGKGRLPLERIKNREKLISLEESRVTNLIHVNDLARVTLKALEIESNEIINVSDGNPIKTTQYYLHIYDALKQPWPGFITFEEALKKYSSKRLSFLNESRLLNVDKMNMLMPGCIKFKDIKEGIRDSLF
tara:strand:+ start:937 stop:1836 length:900 start_codon:yes stop_codon:yes gene_type:complete